MDKNLLMGVWRYLIPVPPQVWKRQVGSPSPLGFMTGDHQRVRNFVVLELPRTGKPLAPAAIAAALELPQENVIHILDSLERHKAFLFRNESGEVTWAYPVTVDRTPHLLTFHTGEQIYAA